MEKKQIVINLDFERWGKDCLLDDAVMLEFDRAILDTIDYFINNYSNKLDMDMNGCIASILLHRRDEMTKQ